MRVLHLYANHKWTGPAEPALNLAAALARRGLEVGFACAPAPSGVHHRLVEEAEARGLAPLTRFGLTKHFRLVGNVRDIRALSAFLRKGDYGVVHAHLLNDHIVGGAAARRAGVPVVRSLYDAPRVAGGLRSRLALRRLTDALLSTSTTAAADARSRLGLPPERVYHVEGAVDLRRFDGCRPLPDLRGTFGVPADAFLVGVVSRMQTHRQYPLLLEAVRLAAARAPRLAVVVVGGGTRREEVAMAPARALGLDDRVRFVGYHYDDEYVATLAAFDALLYLVPGSDGSCRTVREALAMGCPVIASRRGMLAEIVTDGETGWLVEERPEAIAGAIVRMAADPGGARRMRRAARAAAGARFDLEAQAARVEGIYRALAGAGEGA